MRRRDEHVGVIPLLAQPRVGTRPQSRPLFFPDQRTDYRIRCALEIMEQGYCMPLSASRMAALVHLSRSRFEHLFIAETGNTFIPSLREIRLRRATAFLADPSLTIKEIACKVGFASASGFSHAFGKRFGQPPCVWRAAHLGNTQHVRTINSTIGR
jgi:transcriptional regulator GlxA family with amidase domain